MIHGRTQSVKKLAIKTSAFLALSLVAFYFYDTAVTAKDKSVIFEPVQRNFISREEISDALTPSILKNEFPKQAH